MDQRREWRGGVAYRESLGSNVEKHVAAIEMDGGAERPLGFGFTIQGAGSADPRTVNGLARLKQIAKLLESIGSNNIGAGGGASDIQPLMRDGVLADMPDRL